MNNRINIIVATHKKYTMPDDKMYLPLHVGAQGKTNEDGSPLELGYAKDNTGDNISEKNPYYCELTGLYWAWKNCKSDFIGLAHYRRHFSLKNVRNSPFSSVLTYKQIAPLLKKYKLFVPKKRNYYIETLYSHYAHTHYAEHLDETRKIIKKRHPEYLAAYDIVVNRTYGYMFNMMIMDKKLFNDYCTWLFDILFELEKTIDAKNQELSAFQSRFYGRVSEIIFNVWLYQKITMGDIKPQEIYELSCIYTEKIDWKRKVTSFVKAKFLKQKYEGSF